MLLIFTLQTFMCSTVYDYVELFVDILYQICIFCV